MTLSYPKFAKVNGHKYKINTSYKVALKCNEVAESDVSDEERSLAIIYLLFGDKSLDNPKDWEGLLKVALKFLSCGKEDVTDIDEVNMSINEDWSYIQSSFFSDYGIDISKTDMHFWQFFDLLCGLTDKCILNRVRFVRDFDIRQIKDPKEKQKWIKQKEMVALKSERHQKTAEEIEMDKLFEKQLKGGY